MSGYLSGRVFYTDLPAHLKLTLLALTDEADDDGHGIFIGQVRLARKVGVTDRAVRGNLARLRDLGYIERTKRGSSFGRQGRPDHYAVNIEALPSSDEIKVLLRTPEDVAAVPGNTGSPAYGTPEVQRHNTGSPLPPTRELEAPVRKSTREIDTSSPRNPRAKGTNPRGPYLVAFEQLWSTYPRKVGKRAARAAFAKALGRAPAETIIAGAKRYRDDPNRSEEFTAHPTTWLNRDSWEDEPLPSRNGRGGHDPGRDMLAFAAELRSRGL